MLLNPLSLLGLSDNSSCYDDTPDAVFVTIDFEGVHRIMGKTSENGCQVGIALLDTR
jgi:hypothetical protein